MGVVCRPGMREGSCKVLNSSMELLNIVSIYQGRFQRGSERAGLDAVIFSLSEKAGQTLAG